MILHPATSTGLCGNRRFTRNNTGATRLVVVPTGIHAKWLLEYLIRCGYPCATPRSSTLETGLRTVSQFNPEDEMRGEGACLREGHTHSMTNFCADPEMITLALGGDWYGTYGCAPGPGHSPRIGR